jgi:hypothetical protein
MPGRLANGVKVRNKFRYSDNPASMVKNPDWRICEILIGLAGNYRKDYSFPSQEKLLALLKRRVGRSMSRRTLNRHLLALQRGGYIRRKRRSHVDPHRGRVLSSTLYTVCRRYFRRTQYVVEGFVRAITARSPSLSAIRVPNPAQYAETFLRLLIPDRRRRGSRQQLAPV